MLKKNSKLNTYAYYIGAMALLLAYCLVLYSPFTFDEPYNPLPFIYTFGYFLLSFSLVKLYWVKKKLKKWIVLGTSILGGLTTYSLIQFPELHLAVYWVLVVNAITASPFPLIIYWCFEVVFIQHKRVYPNNIE